MTKAGLNTLLGMGTVFIVLILIMAIIYAFGLIPNIEKALADKKAKKQSKTEDAVDNTIAQIIEKEELSDDTELVAVIAAAIAAYEGAASTDGFVVRSIKRANTNKWQRA
jgi:sodium pump decarboxylase gamma subunit